MGPTALLPLRSQSRYRFLSPSKFHHPRSGLNPAKLGSNCRHATTRPPRATSAFSDHRWNYYSQSNAAVSNFVFRLVVVVYVDMVRNFGQQCVFCTNRMWSVVLLGSAGENVALNYRGTQFQVQEASMNLFRKSGSLGHFWTRNYLEDAVCFPKINYTKYGLR
jgi:hypothetical protein